MRKNKYNAKRVFYLGHWFHSQKEANRYGVLLLLEKAGHINNLALQPKFKICDAIMFNGNKLQARNYIADFMYIENGIDIVEDVKGKLTDLYKLKRSLFLTQYPQYKFIET